jgi:uroporphyrinogen-III synthase
MRASIIWTRSKSDWERDAALFGDVPVLHLPCIKTEALPARISRRQFDALVFTSVSGVRCALADAKLGPIVRKVRRVFTHGARTAAVAADMGLEAKLIEEPTGAALGRFLATVLAPGTKLLWPSASQVAHDITEDLAAAGVMVTRVPVYTTTRELCLPSGLAPDAGEKDHLIRTLRGVVCFASPSAVQGFVHTLEPESNRLGRELTAVAIGPTTRDACVPAFEKIVTCHEATTTALAGTGAELLGR